MKGGKQMKQEFEEALIEYNAEKARLIQRLIAKYGKRKVTKWLKSSS